MVCLMLESSGAWSCQFSLSWRKEALSGCVTLPRRPALALAAPPGPRGAGSSRLQPCLALAVVWGRQNSMYSCSEQIHRFGFSGCHVFPHEIPDLVWCVFLKHTHCLQKPQAGKGKHFWLNYQFLKRCQIMVPSVAWICHSFYQLPLQGALHHASASSPGQMWKLRPMEAKGSTLITCTSMDPKSDLFLFDPRSQGQAEAAFAPQACFLWPEVF